MSRTQKAHHFSLRLLITCILILKGHCEVSSRGSDLSTKEILHLLESVAILPEWGETYEGDSFSLLLSYDKDPDYKLLESIQKQQQEQLQESSAKKPVEEEKPVDLNAFFAHREALFIRDPKYLLTTAERIEIQDLLSSYAGEFDYNFHLNLLTQREVAALSELSDEKHQQILAGDQQGISIYYFYDDPGETFVYLSDQSQEGLPKSIKTQIQDASKKHLQYSGDRYRSLYRYLLDVTLEVSNYLQTQQEQQTFVKEVTPAYTEATVDSSDKPSNALKIGWHTIGIISGVTLIVILLVRGILIHRERKQYTFPISNIDDHLGFPRGCSCSGILTFSDSAPSVEEQEKAIYS